MLTLEQWAKAKFGDNAPCIQTLRRWARNGNIHPKPKKVGREFLVQPEAQYINHNEPIDLAELV